MDIMKKYGKVGIITHCAISWTFFAITYLTISRTGQASKIIQYFKLENRIPKNAGTFAISALIYKVAMPGRIALSLLTIPIVCKKLDI